MPGRAFLTTPMADVAQGLDAAPDVVLDEPPRENIAPGQEVIALTPEGWTRMRWGMIPVGRVNARGRPVMETVVNARSETVFDKSAFAGTGRAVMPVNGWYEWTGDGRRKVAWRITPRSGDLLWFAAISDVWSAPGGTQVYQLATVTCAPNGDLRSIHHRMPVLLEMSAIPVWLSGPSEQVRDLMVPWHDGSLKIEEAMGVNWAGP